MKRVQKLICLEFSVILLELGGGGEESSAFLLKGECETLWNQISMLKQYCISKKISFQYSKLSIYGFAAWKNIYIYSPNRNKQSHGMWSKQLLVGIPTIYSNFILHVPSLRRVQSWNFLGWIKRKRLTCRTAGMMKILRCNLTPIWCYKWTFQTTVLMIAWV